MSRNQERRRGFTLIELMIVIAIMAIVAALGLPSFVKSMRKEGMRKAMSDMLEACGNARATAIISGDTAELVIHPKDGTFGVQKSVADPSAQGGQLYTPMIADKPPAPAGPPAFSAHLPDNIAIELLGVNFMEYQEADLARVRFYPNGMSDEFTIILRSDREEWRKITLDSVTALAEVTTIR